MTAAAVDCGVDTDALLGDYLDYVASLGLGERAVRDRTRIAREFLSRNPNLPAWMALPAAQRAAELRSSQAWPLVCYAIGTDRIRLDVELAAVKQLTGLGRAVEARDPAGFASMRDAGNRLGWTSSWVETVLGECLAVLLAWRGGLVVDLDAEVIGEFDAALSASSIPPSSRRAYRARLASLRQLLYETRVVDTAPRRRGWARDLEQRFTDVAMAEPIRETLLRYVRVRAAVLRPKSVESLINDLLPFAEYLIAHHPRLTSLRELDRACIEGYLAWNRTRGWRGRRAAAGAGRAVSGAVAQSAVLSLRSLLDDITAWGWQQAPPRRLVFAADVPKLDQPLPRALGPDVDAAVMNAVAGLDDPFARVGLTVLRAQSFEFLHGPSNEMLVDTPCEGVQLGAVEDPAIADPAAHLRVDLLREAGQIRPTATIEVPCPDLLADSLGRLDTDCRGEAHEVASPAFGQAPPEGVAEEIEAGVPGFPRPVRVLAEHDLRLLGVQLEAECLEPGGDRVPQRAGLILRIAVSDNVIRIPREGTARELPNHPGIKRVMHEHVGQQRGAVPAAGQHRLHALDEHVHGPWQPGGSEHPQASCLSSPQGPAELAPSPLRGLMSNSYLG